MREMKNQFLDEYLLTNPDYMALELKLMGTQDGPVKRTLFVCAMEEELEGFRIALDNEGYSYCSSYEDGFKILSFSINGTKCVAINAGITFFNVGRLSRFIESFTPEQVVNFGTCAGIKDQSKGSIIMTQRTVCNDLDLTNFGYLDGTTLKKRISKIEDQPLIVSGSKFLASDKEKEKVLKRFPDAVAFDMESFMYDCLCREYGIPLLIVRAVSDSGDEEAEGSFEENVVKVSAISSVIAIMRVLLKDIDDPYLK